MSNYIFTIQAIFCEYNQHEFSMGTETFVSQIPLDAKQLISESLPITNKMLKQFLMDYHIQRWIPNQNINWRFIKIANNHVKIIIYYYQDVEFYKTLYIRNPVKKLGFELEPTYFTKQIMNLYYEQYGLNYHHWDVYGYVL